MYVNKWKALLTFHLSKHMAYTHLLLMPVMWCRINILWIMADKFCYVLILLYIFPFLEVNCHNCQNFFGNLYAYVSVTNSCRCQCEQFDLNILHSNYLQFPVIYLLCTRCVKAFSSHCCNFPLRRSKSVTLRPESSVWTGLYSQTGHSLGTMAIIIIS